MKAQLSAIEYELSRFHDFIKAAGDYVEDYDYQLYAKLILLAVEAQRENELEIDRWRYSPGQESET